MLSTSLIGEALGVDLDVQLLFRRELRRGQAQGLAVVSSRRKLSGNRARRFIVAPALLQIASQMALLMFQSRLNRFAEFALRRRLREPAGDPLKDRPRFRVIESPCHRPDARHFDQKRLEYVTFLEVRKPLGALVNEDFRPRFAAKRVRELSLGRYEFFRIGVRSGLSLELMESP